MGRFDAALGRWVAVPIDLGPPSDEVVLVLFGTGLRFASSSAATSASIGEAAAPVLYAGRRGALSGWIGHLSLDRGLAGRGEVEVRLSVDGKAANVVKVTSCMDADTAIDHGERGARKSWSALSPPPLL